MVEDFWRLREAIDEELKDMSEDEKTDWLLSTIMDPEYNALMFHVFESTDSEIDRMRFLVKKSRAELEHVRKWKRRRRER